MPRLALRLAFPVPLLKSLHGEREPPLAALAVAPGLAPGANPAQTERGDEETERLPAFREGTDTLLLTPGRNDPALKPRGSAAPNNVGRSAQAERF